MAKNVDMVQLDPEDYQNYIELYQDLVKDGALTKDSEVISIYQYFSMLDVYLGAVFVVDTSSNSRKWIWVAEDWETVLFANVRELYSYVCRQAGAKIFRIKEYSKLYSAADDRFYEHSAYTFNLTHFITEA